MSDEVTKTAAGSPDSSAAGTAALEEPRPVGVEASSPAAEMERDVVDAVYSVRDRFGGQGLRDLIALAEHELVVTERALAELARSQQPPPDS